MEPFNVVPLDHGNVTAWRNTTPVYENSSLGSTDNVTVVNGKYTNESLREHYDWYEYMEAMRIIAYITILRIVISSLGVMFNVSSIMALMKIHWRQKAYYKLLLSLAVSDMTVAALHVIVTFVKFRTGWSLLYEGSPRSTYKNPAVVLSYIYFIAQTAGLVNMVSIAVDLLIAVKMPLRHSHLMSSRRTNILVACIWAVPTIISLAVGIADGLLSSIYRTHPFGIATQLASAFIILLSNLSFIVFFVLYVIIYCGIRSAHANFPRQRTRSLRKASLTTLLIIVTYAICMTPITMSVLIVIVGMPLNSINILLMLPEVVQCLFVLNTICDPLIYAERMPDVRAAYINIFYRCTWLSRHGDQPTQASTDV